MNDADVLAYVKASALVLNVPLDAARAQAVAATLLRTQAMAEQLECFEMPLEEEVSAIFCPAPFPTPEQERGAA